jgi:hypothetical protein
MIFLALNNAAMRFFVVKQSLNKIFCFTDNQMRHLENRSLEKCIVSYWFINLKLFYPELRNFDQNDMRFLDNREFFSDLEI